MFTTVVLDVILSILPVDKKTDFNTSHISLPLYEA